MEKIVKRKFPFACIARLIFTLIGFIYALIFTIKGIFLLLAIFSKVLGGSEGKISINQTLIEVFNNSPNHWFDVIIRVFNILILIHAVIGVYYILSTSFKTKPMSKEKKLFLLQIISSIAILIFIILLIKTSGVTDLRMGVFWVLNILISIFGGYHIGKGFFNACITLGITLTQRSRRVIRVLAWIIGAFSIMQITVSLI